MRLAGEQKATFTVWFTLGQRTLHYETYVMPAPDGEPGRSSTSTCCGATSSSTGPPSPSGAEDAMFLVGQVGVAALDEDELDRVLGSLYAWVEQFFRPAMRIGYASVFKG